jgi:hypothetical protein
MRSIVPSVAQNMENPLAYPQIVAPFSRAAVVQVS